MGKITISYNRHATCHPSPIFATQDNICPGSLIKRAISTTPATWRQHQKQPAGDGTGSEQRCLRINTPAEDRAVCGSRPGAESYSVSYPIYTHTTTCLHTQPIDTGIPGSRDHAASLHPGGAHLVLISILAQYTYRGWEVVQRVSHRPTAVKGLRTITKVSGGRVGYR